MEYSFPPEPPGYIVVLVARSLLLAWVAIGFGILVVRFRRRKFVKNREMVLWSSAAAICAALAPFGICRFYWFDKNEWLIPLLIAAISVSVAGITIGLTKLYAEGNEKAKDRAMELGIVVVIIVALADLLIEPGLNYWGDGRYLRCRNNLR